MAAWGSRELATVWAAGMDPLRIGRPRPDREEYLPTNSNSPSLEDLPGMCYRSRPTGLPRVPAGSFLLPTSQCQRRTKRRCEALIKALLAPGIRSDGGKTWSKALEASEPALALFRPTRTLY